MTDQERQTEIKRLRHRIGVSDQNYRYTGNPKHRANAMAFRAELKAVTASQTEGA